MIDSHKAEYNIVTKAFILLFLFWLAANLILITSQSLIFIKHLMKRKYGLKSFKELAKKVNKVADVLRKDLNSDIQKEKTMPEMEIDHEEHL